MDIINIDGVPALVSKRDRRPRTVRIKVKKRKPLKELGIKSLKPKQRQALQNLLTMGFDHKKEALTAAGYSPNHIARDTTRLLSRKPIIKALKDKGVTDDKIAEVIAEGLEATHPLSKENKKDYKAIVKFVQEADKLLDNYPPTKIQSEEKHIILHITPEDIKANNKVKELRGEYDRGPF